MRRVIAARKNAPMFLIDIAVPRNIEPAVNELDNVFLYDIDDLQKVVDTNLKGRMQEAEEAEQIIAEEVERMMLAPEDARGGAHDRQPAGAAGAACARPRWRGAAASSGR